jgi:hypothetical protein
MTLRGLSVRLVMTSLRRISPSQVSTVTKVLLLKVLLNENLNGYAIFKFCKNRFRASVVSCVQMEGDKEILRGARGGQHTQLNKNTGWS